MKRMFRSLRSLEAAALVAALFIACSPAAWGATEVSSLTTARAPFLAAQHTASSKLHTTGPSMQTAFQKMEERRAKLTAMSQTGFGQRRQQRLEKQQHFLTEMQKNMPAGSKTAMAQAARANGLAVNFPGFLQGEVHTAGNSPSEPYNTLVALSADVNKDGLPDLVNIQLDGTVNTLLNPGKGKLSSMQLSSVNKSATAQRYVEYAAAVDLHGNGYPDIAMLDYGSNTVFVLPNAKDGTFGTATSQVVKFSSGASFQSGGGLAFGDFNGDGKQDMVAYCMTYGYNDADQPVTSFELVTFPGNGDGTFAAPLPEQYTLLNSYGTTMPGQIAVVDTNKDGKLDFTFMAGGFDANDNQELYVTTLLGDGTGVFSNPSPTLPAAGAIAAGLADGAIVGGMTVQDFDGDGIPDVLFGNCENSNLYLALGNGDGTYKDATTVITTFGYPGALNFADMNGDGVTDVVAYGYGYIAIFPGLGKGAFSSSPMVQFVSGNTGFQEPQPADFDGDGSPDLASSDAATNVTAVYLETKGKFSASASLAVTGESASYMQVVASADFNGDGAPDVLGLDYTPLWDGTVQQHEPYPNVVIGVNDGKGNFKYQVVLGHEALYAMNANDADGGLLQPLAADFNGDHFADLLLHGADGGLWIVLSKADGTYADPAQVPLTPTNNCGLSRADAGDLNGDGKLDLVFAYPGDSVCSGGTTPSGVYSLLSKGDGTFTSSFTAVGSAAYEPKLIDFNGDGKLDLALSDADFNSFTYGFEVVPGNGDGTFNASAKTQPLGTNAAISAIIPGDFNSDGKQDLVVGVEFRFTGPYQFIGGTTGVAMLPGNGDFSFGYAQDYFFEAFPNDGKFADFNGDGKPDLALNVGFFPFGAAPVLSNFGYMVNLGDGNFSTFQPTATGVYDQGGYLGAGDFNATGTVLVGDFNGDGAIDALSTLDYDDEYHYSSQLYLNVGAIGFSLTSSAATAAQGAPVVLTAALTPSVSSKTPSGSVSFYDNGTLLQTVPVDGTSVSATFSGLPVGANVISASYTGDSNFNAASASTGVSVAITALAPNFTLAAATPATLTLAQGATGITTMMLTGNATFSGAVTFACSGAPTEATCTVSPGTVTLAAGQSVMTTVVVATTAKNNVFSAHNSSRGWMQAAGGTVFAAGLVCFWPGRRRRMAKVWMLMLVFAGTAAMFSTTGCGGSGDKYPGTPIGNATLTVTATSGSLSQSQTITLAITQSK